MAATWSCRAQTNWPFTGDCEASVIVLEYAVHGQAVQTGRTYDNHFVSVITIKDRKVTHWRDYLDPVAIFNALGWPAP